MANINWIYYIPGTILNAIYINSFNTYNNSDKETGTQRCEVSYPRLHS